MDFIPASKKDIEEMKKEIGISSSDELFKDIPSSILQKTNLNLQKPLSESELKKHFECLAGKNKLFKVSFLGAGAYSHYIPSAVNHIISRSEFYTAYTPYQAEMSQGILQAIFEYQTMICRLTGMHASNASLYDCAEALAEAANICINKSGKNEILIARSAHPEYKQTVKTYLDARDKILIEVDFDKYGQIDIADLNKKLSEKTAGILIQSPNFFGTIEDIDSISKIAHERSMLLTVAISDPTCLGLLKSPGDLGADIVVLEGQSFGNPKSFGGPYLGIIAVKDLVRYMPGRIVGETVDKDGKKGYILTLQAREQHIRREKASSNICSNEALNALAATAYISCLGKTGMRKVAEQNLQKANYMKQQLKQKGIKIKFDSHCYNEFVIELENDAMHKSLKKTLEEKNIEPGFSLSCFYPELKNCMLICVTEMITKTDIDRFIDILSSINGSGGK